MILLQDKGRKYRRYRPSAQEKILLANNGLQWVLSSNVSAVGTNNDDLIVRFHNGGLYIYYNQAKLYDNMLKSNSKGRFVWDRLRRANIPYKKLDNLPLESDINLSDDEIFNLIDTAGAELDKYLRRLGMFIPESNNNTLELINLNSLLR